MKNFISIIISVFCLQLVSGQEAVPDQRILDASCSCINKIDIFSTLEVKNDSIKRCIDFANLNIQLLDNLTNKNEKDSLTNIIIANKDYDIIQKKLLKDCTFLKDLLMYDSNKFDHSVSDNKKAVDFYTQGVRYSEQGKYDLALVEYNKAVKKDPKFAFAWDNMGICYRKTNRYKEAINCYKKSLELDPKGNMPLMNMGVAYDLLKDYKAASEVYLKYIEYYPEDPEGFYGAGRMFYLDKKHEKGLDYIFQAYLIYKKTGSPYIHDAESTINSFYSDMKENNELEKFQKTADKYNIRMN